MKQSFQCFMNVKCYSNQIVSIGRERMPRLNVLQHAIIVLTKNGLSQRQIAEQVGCSKTAVKKTQDKYRATNSITDMARSGRPQVTTERTDRHIAILSKSNRFKLATAIRDKLEVVCGVNVSVSTVKRVLDKAGLRARVSRRKPALSSRNRKNVLISQNSHITSIRTGRRRNGAMFSSQTNLGFSSTVVMAGLMSVEWREKPTSFDAYRRPRTRRRLSDGVGRNLY